MSKELCLIHANCQGEPLMNRLLTCPEFTNRFEYKLYTNYIKEPIPDAEIRRCSLFLYQYLGPTWKELASEELLAKLPPNANALCIPNMFFKGYWPFWSGTSGFDYRCTHLDSCIQLGLTYEETLVLFLKSPIRKKYDLNALFEESIRTERGRESHTPIKYVDFLLTHFTSEKLFKTVNHPAPTLLDYTAVRVAQFLGIQPPTKQELASFNNDFSEFEQPINPQVAAHFGWDFATSETQYNVYGRPMTHAQYVANYIEAQKKGITDFISFLQGLPLNEAILPEA